jgi:acetolactate synthase regulatory subunit
MAPRKQLARESVPVTLSSQRAIELLRKQLARIDEIKQLRYNDPEIKKWVLTTSLWSCPANRVCVEN